MRPHCYGCAGKLLEFFFQFKFRESRQNGVTPYSVSGPDNVFVRNTFRNGEFAKGGDFIVEQVVDGSLIEWSDETGDVLRMSRGY